MEHCDCDDCLCGGESWAEETIEGRTHIEATDALNDLIKGFEHWKNTKVTSGTWNDYDETFARWIEAGPLSAEPRASISVPRLSYGRNH